MDVNYITETHILYYLTRGIQTSCRLTEPPISINDLTQDDFNERRIFQINNKIESKKNEFEFTTYSPDVFQGLRSFYKIDNFYDEIIKNNEIPFEEFKSPGKSGSLFFLKNEYLFKQVEKEELDILIKHLNDYLDYLKFCKLTLLPRYYGAYSIKLENKNVHFIVTNYLFHQCQIDSIYDLKGSTSGRETNHQDINDEVIFKDIDFIDHEKLITIPSNHKRKEFTYQLKRDVIFLSQFGLMDYSLLVGFGQTSYKPHKLKCVSYDNDNGETVYLGLIDCLTKYTLKKNFQTFINSMSIPKKEASAIPPKEYRTRFIKFINTITK
ncbi:Phosphatidylinositol 4-phosphate 5-kinase MSS4 [Candida tropicalis]